MEVAENGRRDIGRVKADSDDSIVSQSKKFAVLRPRSLASPSAVREPSQILEALRHGDESVSKASPIHGNIYTYWAFMDVLERHRMIDMNDARSKVLQVGLFFVMIVQIIGPPAVLIWSLYAIIWDDVKIGLGSWEYIPGSYHKGISNLSARLLAFLFLFVFILNGIYVVRDDKKTSSKIWYMVTVLDEGGKGNSGVNRFWLRAGAIINSWCVVLSAFCMLPCFTLSKNPKDVIFDAFALLFLFRLDDVTGELGFLDDQWDSEMFGTFYEYVKEGKRLQEEKLEERREVEPLDSTSEAGESDAESRRGCTVEGQDCTLPGTPGCSIYKGASAILSMCLVVIPTLFVFLEGAVARRDTERAEEHFLEWSQMKKDMALLQAQMATLAKGA